METAILVDTLPIRPVTCDDALPPQPVIGRVFPTRNIADHHLVRPYTPDFHGFACTHPEKYAKNLLTNGARVAIMHHAPGRLAQLARASA